MSPLMIDHDKPLSKWTLSEVLALCREREGDDPCAGCRFANKRGCCTLCGVIPVDWNLEESLHYTDEERILADILSRHGVTDFTRKEGYGLHWRGEGRGQLPMTLFPSIKLGQTVAAEEIAKD